MYSSSYGPDLPSVRLLLLGDSGVGKTSLAARIARDKLPSNLKWTQQANVEIMMHICGHKSYFIEFIDISGLIANKMARQVYYKKIDGIVLVFDTNNKKSYHNLRHWLKEYYDAEFNKLESPHPSSSSFFPQIIIGSRSNGHRMQEMNHLPLFTIGNKTDLHSDYKVKHVLPNEFKCEQDYGYQFAFMSALLRQKYQRPALSEFEKYLDSIIAKIEELQSRHSIHSGYSPMSSVSSSKSDTAECQRIERNDSNSSLSSASSLKSKRKFFSFW